MNARASDLASQLQGIAVTSIALLERQGQEYQRHAEPRADAEIGR
jgi:hypothetical protein